METLVLGKDWTLEMIEYLKAYGKHRGFTGRAHSEESKSQTSKALIGRSKGPFSEEHKQNISKAQKKRWEGLPEEEQQERIRLWHSNDAQAAETRRHMPEIGQRISVSLKRFFEASPAKPLSKETRQKISKANTGHSTSTEQRQAVSKASSSRSLSEETKKRISTSMRKYLVSLSSEEIEARMKHSCRSPEAVEYRYDGPGYLQSQRCFYLILEEYFPGEWVHNGGQPDSVWIAGLEPDFIHKQQRKVIEYFEFWAHRDLEEEAKKSLRYQQGGYELLVVREEDLWVDGTEAIVSRVKEYLQTKVLIMRGG